MTAIAPRRPPARRPRRGPPRPTSRARRSPSRCSAPAAGGRAPYLTTLFWYSRLRPSSRAKLAELSFIHFARWTLVSACRDGQRLRYAHLFFESNFNGGWEEYIDAFSHVLTKGMKKFWGSSYGYPGRAADRAVQGLHPAQRGRRQPLLVGLSRRDDHDDHGRARARRSGWRAQGRDRRARRRGVRRRVAATCSRRRRDGSEPASRPRRAGHGVHVAGADRGGGGGGAARAAGGATRPRRARSRACPARTSGAG